ELVENIVHLFQQNRARLVALMMLEVGKPVWEADADVAEAIDFCKYYLSLRRSLGRSELPRTTDLNLFLYEPRGITAVICPWNFPVAIPTGMIIANLLVGNPVVFKPAEQATMLGNEVFQIFRNAGFDETKLIFAPGYGDTVGEFLVRAAEVSTILFTGSKAVGMRILNLTANNHSEAGFKKLICELGGKNAIYIDEEVDCDEAVDIVIQSAFGYAGQKCSACSRLFVHKAISSQILAKLVTQIQSIRTGSAKDPETFLPYVIDRDSYYRLETYVDKAEKEGLVMAKSGYPESHAASFIPATLVFNPRPDSPYAREELFGPILSYFEVNDFNEALEQINSVDYALTGGVITKSRDIVEKAIRNFNCGNLYINRKITGALVGCQPFGGRKFSGTGFKAGGKNYLLQLVHEKAVSVRGFENLQDFFK
ncbi:MAG: aldehyde dehydrogenase family protein, partial [Deltaproteobacteria bacterium]|nr:aldehyde dehydrogenase family protein [Deltaproteobacteria bacterium]